MEEKWCLICKSKDHTSRECTRPGGGKDPERDKRWDEYRARREKAMQDGKAGKGAKASGKGAKGKGKGKKRDEQKGRAKGTSKGAGATAGACLDLASAAAARFDAYGRT